MAAVAILNLLGYYCQFCSRDLFSVVAGYTPAKFYLSQNGR